MNTSTENITFTQSWAERAVRNFLKKEQGDITAEDIFRIKYLRIGESFDNDFIIQMSTENPPEPFADTDGGDEWIFAVRGKDIEKFLTDSHTDLHQLSVFGFECEEDSYASSRNAEKKWEGYRDSIYEERYYEQIEDYDKWKQWYENVKLNLYRDLKLFSGLTVLRIQGMELPDFTVFETMKNLKVLELVGTGFCEKDGVEKLYGLKQLACWLD